MIHELPALDQHARIVERTLQIPAGPHALPKESIAEIGPVALGRAAERGMFCVRGRKHDRIVVGERRHEYPCKAGRYDDDAVLDALVIERGHNLPRRQFDNSFVGQAQAEASRLSVRRHQQKKHVVVFVHRLAEGVDRGSKIGRIRERQVLERFALIDEAQRVPLDRKDIAEYGQSAVKFFSKNILPRPPGDADGVDIARAMLWWRKVGDFGAEQRALRWLQTRRLRLARRRHSPLTPLSWYAALPTHWHCERQSRGQQRPARAARSRSPPRAPPRARRRGQEQEAIATARNCAAPRQSLRSTKPRSQQRLRSMRRSKQRSTAPPLAAA